MKQLTCCFYLFLLVSMSVNAQDVLLQKLLAAENDTTKVIQLNDYARDLTNTDKKKAEKLLVNVLQLGKQLGYDKGIAYSWMLRGNIKLYEGKFNEALIHYRSGVDYYHKAGDPLGAAKCFSNIGVSYSALGKLDSTTVYYLAAIKEFEKVRSQARENLAIAYMNLAIHYKESFKSSSGKPDYRTSIYYYKQAEILAREAKDTIDLIPILSNLSTTYSGINPDTALVYGKQALEVAIAQNEYRGLTGANNACAVSLRELKQLDVALHYAKNATHYARLAEDQDLYNISHTTLASIYGAQGNYKEQINVLKSLLKNANANSFLVSTQEIYETLAMAYYKSGNYKAAFDHYQKSAHYKDSILSLEKGKLLVDAETKYQSEKKERQLTQQQLKMVQNEAQLRNSKELNFFSLGALLIVLLTSALVVVNYRNKRSLHRQEILTIYREKQNQLLHAAMEGEEKERSRIAKDLHDGVAGMLAAAKMHFSSLSITNGFLSTIKEYNQGLSLLDEAASQVRQTSHNLMPEVLTRFGLESALAKYCSNISNEKVLVVKYDCWGDVKRYDSNFELAVYRIVQELLNNVIKHSQATEASVQLSAFEGRLSILIEDNGVGLKASEKAEGVGLQSLETRIKAMNGHFEIQTASSKGLTAYLEFNIEGLESNPNDHLC